jgi:site-specific DNA-methyltransferase (adenine-specific)
MVHSLKTLSFDIIIGNPPFNNENDKAPTPIYNKFIEKSLLFNPTYLSFIIPSRWFAGGRGLDKFREMMLNRNDIQFINHFEDASKVFGKDVDIKGGVNYFLIDKKYSGSCNFNGSMIKLNKYDILINNNKYYSIIDKISSYDNISLLYKSQRIYKIEIIDKRLSNIKQNSNYIKCYVSQQKGNIKYIDKNFVKRDISRWKVITTQASGKGYDGFGNIFVGKPNEVHNASYISFEVKNENEAKSLFSYLKSKFANFMLSLRKNTQNISEKTLLWVPLVPLDKEWTDEELFKFSKEQFNLTDEEISLIKNH